MAVEITRTDMSASELRTTAARTKDAKAARRMLAIALVLDGTDRRTAAEACGMDRQTLRDWVHRYNADGIAGLSNRYAAGPTPLLNPEQKVELARMVREGPDLEADGVVRWRCVDLKRKIEDRFGVVMHERTVGKQLAALGIMVQRPWTCLRGSGWRQFRTVFCVAVNKAPDQAQQFLLLRPEAALK